jgi:hypothetical protein
LIGVTATRGTVGLLLLFELGCEGIPGVCNLSLVPLLLTDMLMKLILENVASMGFNAAGASIFYFERVWLT